MAGTKLLIRYDRPFEDFLAAMRTDPHTYKWGPDGFVVTDHGESHVRGTINGAVVHFDLGGEYCTLSLRASSLYNVKKDLSRLLTDIGRRGIVLTRDGSEPRRFDE